MSGANASGTHRTYVDLSHVLALSLKVSYMVFLLLGSAFEQLRGIGETVGRIVVTGINGVGKRLGEPRKVCSVCAYAGQRSMSGVLRDAGTYLPLSSQQATICSTVGLLQE
jgi:hypothetical protein